MWTCSLVVSTDTIILYWNPQDLGSDLGSIRVMPTNSWSGTHDCGFAIDVRTEMPPVSGASWVIYLWHLGCVTSLWRFNSLVQHFWQHHRFFPHFLYPLAFKQKLCATVLHGHQAEITSAVWSVDCGSDGHQIPRARLWIIHWAKHLVMSDLLTVFSIGTNDDSEMTRPVYCNSIHRSYLLFTAVIYWLLVPLTVANPAQST